MGTRMTHHPEGFGIFLGQEPELDFALFGEKRVRSHHLPIHLGGERRFCQPGADISGNIYRTNVTRILFDRSVGQMDF